MLKWTTRGPSRLSTTISGPNCPCTRPVWWMAAIPVAQPIASARSVSAGSGPSSATICASVAPGTDSVIR